MKKHFTTLKVLLSAFILAVTVSCNKNDSPTAPTNVEDTEDNTGSVTADSESTLNLIALAGRETYRKHVGVKSESADTKGDDEKIRYPFTTVTVYGVTHYTAEPFDVPCAADPDSADPAVAGQFTGISELYITEYCLDTNGSSLLLTLLYADGKEYSCVVNGGSLEETYFSSHIQLTSDAIEKDPAYPIFSFHIRDSGENSEFGYKISVSPEKQGSQEAGYWTSLGNKSVVKAADEWTVDDLTEILSQLMAKE
ncbi:MAG: hypothetical protein LBR06_05915 [Bacteroidales bacterium]|jgi:hypothetical protein|nr:hypothetical protein [Bacteroidales bacterium]